MVNLIAQNRITSLNIDTVERAIVFSGLVLHYATGTTNDAELISKIKLDITTKGKSELILKIDAYLSLDSTDFITYGGSILESIASFDIPQINLDNQFNFSIAPTEPAINNFPLFPIDLPQNFETYFYYYVSILSASLPENRNEYIRISPKRSNFEGSTVQVKLSLPIDSNKWLLGKSLIESVQQLVTEYQSDIDYNQLEFTTLSYLGNDELLGNVELLENGILPPIDTALSLIGNTELLGNTEQIGN